MDLEQARVVAVGVATSNELLPTSEQKALLYLVQASRDLERAQERLRRVREMCENAEVWEPVNAEEMLDVLDEP